MANYWIGAVILIAVAVFQVYKLKKEGLRNEIFVYCGLTLSALCLGYYYMQVIHKDSLIKLVFRILGMEQ